MNIDLFEQPLLFFIEEGKAVGERGHDLGRSAADLGFFQSVEFPLDIGFQSRETGEQGFEMPDFRRRRSPV
jgi:hypothetical protein